MSRLVNALLELLFPPRCPLCGELRTRREALCPACKAALPAERISVPHERPGLLLVAPFAYEGAVREGILALKRAKNSELELFFAAEMAAALQKAAFPACTVATAVPPSAASLKRHGYDHAGSLAQAVAGVLGLPYRDDLLLREEESLPQHRQSAALRHENAQKSYRRRPGAQVSGTVLLIDDVATTGETLRACQKALREAGAGRVCCLTAASTPIKKS